MTFSGKIGFGSKVHGEIKILDGTGIRPAIAELDSSCAGRIIVLLSTASRELLEKAGIIGIVGLVAPSIHYRDFDYFRSQNEYPLLVLQKFGNLEMSDETRKKIEKFDGKKGTLSGEEKTLTV